MISLVCGAALFVVGLVMLTLGDRARRDAYHRSVRAIRDADERADKQIREIRQDAQATIGELVSQLLYMTGRTWTKPPAQLEQAPATPRPRIFGEGTFVEAPDVDEAPSAFHG